MYIVHCTWQRSQSPFLFRFSHGPILVQINLRHSQTQPSNSLICGASHREEVSTIFKAFGMTRPRVGQNPGPSELLADLLPLHYSIESVWNMSNIKQYHNGKKKIKLFSDKRKRVLEIYFMTNLCFIFKIILILKMKTVSSTVLDEVN